MQATQQLTLNMPLFIWAIVGVLTLLWIYVMLPAKYKSSKPAGSRYLQLEHDFGPAAPAAAAAPAPAAKWTLELLHQLDSRQLDELIRGFWIARSCNVEAVGTSLVINRPATGRAFAVAQHQTSGADKVGVDAVRALWEVVQQRSAPLGLYYSLTGFTPEALTFAKDKALKLLMGSDLLTEINHLRPDTQRGLVERVAAPAQALAA